jgi:hypothetical protein
MNDCELFIAYDPSNESGSPDVSKKMVVFLEDKIDLINKIGHVLSIKAFDISDENICDRLEKMGIDELPCLVCSGNKIIGYKNIKRYLTTKPKKYNTEEQVADELHDYQLDIMNEGDESVEKSSNAQLQARLAEEVTRRKMDKPAPKKKSADDIVREQRAKSKKKPQQIQESESEGEQEQEQEPDTPPPIKRRTKTKQAGNPADVAKSLKSKDPESRKDEDLVAKFWANREATDV